MSLPHPDPLAALEQARSRLVESLWADFGSGSDAWLRLRGLGRDPGAWVPISVPSDRRHGQNWPVWRTEQELDDLRQRSRVTAATNGYAMCLTQNLQNYVVGDGCKYKIAWKQGLEGGDADPDAPGVQEPDLVTRGQGELDRLMSLNRWNGQGDPQSGRVVTESREREIVRRVPRDGEAILRYYPDGDDLHVRFVEPEQLRQAPGGETFADGWAFGVRHKMEPYEDVETPEEYHLLWQDPATLPGRASPAGERVDAAQILHLKAPGTDGTLARGTPLFVFDVGDALERASKLQRYLSISSAIRAATAEVWKHQATAAQVQSLAGALASRTETDPRTGKAQNVEDLPPGSIRRVPDGQEPVPMPTTTGVPEYLQAAQGDLRLASAGVCAPEYLTGDASNNNFASIKEAGTPWVQQARSLQGYYLFAFRCVAWRMIRHAVERGRLPPEALTDLEIQVEGPAVLHKDPLQTAQADQILKGLGKSPQTILMEHGLDPEVEGANTEDWQARFPPQPQPQGSGVRGQQEGRATRPFREAADRGGEFAPGGGRVPAKGSRDEGKGSGTASATAPALQNAFDGAVRRAALSAKKREEFSEAAGEVFGRLAPGALARFGANVKGYAMHPETGALTAALTAERPGLVALLKGDHAAGAYVQSTGVLWLDSHGRSLFQHEVYAHEFGHAVDGPDGELSGAPAWREAWQSEVVGRGGLSEYAKTSPAEGFAEFSRLLHSDDDGRAQAARSFPACSAYWKERGVW